LRIEGVAVRAGRRAVDCSGAVTAANRAVALFALHAIEFVPGRFGCGERARRLIAQLLRIRLQRRDASGKLVELLLRRRIRAECRRTRARRAGSRDQRFAHIGYPKKKNRVAHGDEWTASRAERSFHGDIAIVRPERGK